MTILEVEDITVTFGGLVANNGISLGIEEGEIVGLIGPNGAGKTTLFNTITGRYQPDTGSIKFRGTDIVGLRSDQINKLGVARTFQKTRPLGGMSVLENVMIGALCRTSDLIEAREIAMENIEFVGLTHKKDDLSDALSTGQRKRLEMARALATKPALLLLDEVTGGVDPQGVPQLVELIHGLREKGATLFVIEHRMKVLTSISEKLIALHLGQKIAEGTPKHVANSAVVIESYLGRNYA